MDSNIDRVLIGYASCRMAVAFPFTVGTHGAFVSCAGSRSHLTGDGTDHSCEAPFWVLPECRVCVKKEPPSEQVDPLKAIAQAQQCVRISPVLSQKISSRSANPTKCCDGFPVLVQRLSVLRLQPTAITVLSHGTFKGKGAIRINGQRCPSYKRFGQSPIW